MITKEWLNYTVESDTKKKKIWDLPNHGPLLLLQKHSFDPHKTQDLPDIKRSTKSIQQWEDLCIGTTFLRILMILAVLYYFIVI